MRKYIFLLIIFIASCTSCQKDEPTPEPDPNPVTGESIGIQVADPSDFFLSLETETGQINWTIQENLVRVEEPSSIIRVVVEGDATLDVEDLFGAIPALKVINTANGTNAIGELTALPPTLTHLDIKEGEMTGVTPLHEGIIRFRVGIGNRVGVDVGNLPSTLEYLCLNRETQAFGVIQNNFPPNIRRYNVVGTVRGDYGLIGQKFPEVFNLDGENEVSTYTAGKVDFAEVNMRIFIHNGSPMYGMSAKDVDNLLVDLSKSTWGGTKRLTIAGTHAAPTPASKQARISLEEQGVIIKTN